MIRIVTLSLAVVFFLAVIATVVFVPLGIVSSWGWFIPAAVSLVVAAVSGAMALTGSWIWALVTADE